MIEEPEVRTTAGLLRGRRHGDLVAFRGIPYAQPPVGRLRFMAPVPAESWDGSREAFTFGLPPPQTPPAGLAPIAAHEDSGDWLTLNVWTPDPGAAGLPVLVWICGGAYLQADSANPHYDGAALARAGAVVVSVNYRVGVEGFARIAGAPDNRGISDQAAALGWVQDNIRAFGGDPGNVTVLGQSAGAGSVTALLVMPTAAGLFRRAIVQSLPGTFFSPRLAADIATTIAREAGCRATVDDLARRPPHVLTRATTAVIRTLPHRAASWGPVASTSSPFSPVVDGDVLPRAPWAALADGVAADVDLLVGHTRDEFRLLAARLATRITDDQVSARLDGLLPDGDAAYRDAFSTASPAARYELAMADWLFRMPGLHLAEAHCTAGGRTWFYELCWGYGPNGATHGLDVLLVLGTVEQVLEGDERRPEIVDAARRLAGRMRTDVVAFARDGHPGWHPHDPESRLTRVYDADPMTRPYPQESSRRLWRGHRFDVLDLVR